MRTADELLESGLAVIHDAYLRGAYKCCPLFSGGHDSLCACYIASQHESFDGRVYHIDTGIGAKYTREFVERVCSKFGWKLLVHKSKETYDKFVRERGFPGPGRHQWVYNRLKDRGVRQIVKGTKPFTNMAMLVTGCRKQESVRRMGTVEPFKIGELDKDGNKTNCNRAWTAPCHNWSKAEQQHFMDEHGLPINKLKVALGLSGECFCGAFAQPGELKMIRIHAPDVAAEIDRLTEIAKACGKPCVWGQRPSGERATVETGPLCSSCDQRAMASGLMVIQS